MKPIMHGLAAALVAVAATQVASAQTANAQTANTPTAPAVPPAATPAPANNSGNAAINTQSGNAATPAKGANSFTMGEARSRIERNGFTNVTGLAKDADGIWRGRAEKGGAATGVWLDFKGNVGTN